MIFATSWGSPGPEVEAPWLCVTAVLQVEVNRPGGRHPSQLAHLHLGNRCSLQTFILLLDLLSFCDRLKFPQ